MPADLYDTKEPLLRCLQDSLAAWHGALHRILAQSGVSPDEWQLLTQLAEQDPEARDERSRMPKSAAAAYAVREPELPGWGARPKRDTPVALSDAGGTNPGVDGGMPPSAIRIAARCRLDKLRQAVSALQSAWVAPLTLEERGQMIAYLTRMQRQLDRCAPRAYAALEGRCVDDGLPGGENSLQASTHEGGAGR